MNSLIKASLLKISRRLISTGLLAFLTCAAFAQNTSQSNLSAIINSVNSFYSSQSLEKLYLHTDKASYFPGDTLWLKAYLLNASFLKPSEKSGVLYVEIASDSNSVVSRIMLPVYGGLTFGQIALGKELPQGGYVLRAYTNWMRNFGETYIFQKPFNIISAAEKDWQVHYNAAAAKENDKNKLQLKLRLNYFNQNPLSFHELQIRLSDDKRTWFKGSETTSREGLLKLNLDLPENLNFKKISLNLQSKQIDGNSLWLPVALNRPDHIDLQFMPEGGELVSGLPVRVAFKALNEDGMAAELSGKICSSKAKEICVFRSVHKGMGSFEFTPEAGEVYSAKVTLPMGGYKIYPLPAVKNEGISLRVNNRYQSDSCEVLIRASPELMTKEKTFFLIAQARGIVCYGSAFNLSQGFVRFKLSNKLFPTGIVRFTLTGQDKAVLNERIAFIDHADNLIIRAAWNKSFYSFRDSAALQIKVSDKDGLPVQGRFSVAVTDDNQVKTDSISDYSIVNQILLASDLRGTIEHPGYYMYSTRSADVWKNLDLLLLTQGWTGNNWEDSFKPSKSMIYPAEPEFLVKGKVLNVFNKPVAAARVTLLNKKNTLVHQASTNEQGVFLFRGIFPSDNAAFFIQAANKRGKNFNVGIEIDQFKPPVFSSFGPRRQPWYVNTDTAALNLASKRISLSSAKEKLTGKNVLNDVIVKSKKFVRESKNLNGIGGADFTISQADLEKAGRTTLGDLLRKNVKGFGTRMAKDGSLNYVINSQRVHLIIDGVNIERGLTEGTSLYNYLNEFFNSYDAEEIRGIEVMTSMNVRYVNEYLAAQQQLVPFDNAFIEVTTRSGNGPNVKKSTGTYLYRPMPYSALKRFYSPRYQAKSIPDRTDIRSTIHWQPDLITNKEGIGFINFYTADYPGIYSVIIEGTDMKGTFGVKRAKMIVKQ